MPLTPEHPTLPLPEFAGIDWREPPNRPDPDDEIEPCTDCGSTSHDKYDCDSFYCEYNRHGWGGQERGHWVTSDDPEYDDFAGEGCPNCQLCSRHCECAECSYCGERTSDDICAECDRCDTCCECYVCSSCDARSRNDPNCSLCERCDHCCECYHCSDCGENYRYSDSMCGQSEFDHCTECCQCEDEDEGYESDEPSHDQSYPSAGSPRFHTPRADQLTRHPSTRYASLEIEVADTRSPSPAFSSIGRWGGQIVGDASIHGNYRREFNTAPAAGDLLIDQLADIGRDIKRYGATANSSCGLHVHVDCRDFTFWDMRRLVFLYEKIEPALFGMVDPERGSGDPHGPGQWCKPCGNSYAESMRRCEMPNEDGAKKAIVCKLYRCETDDQSVNRAIRKAKTDKYMSVRYHALNLHSWIYRGTVECRIHHGTTNVTNLINWARLWTAIVDKAYAMTERDIERLEDDSLDILLSVAPDDSVRDWIRDRTEYYASTEYANKTLANPDAELSDPLGELLQP